MAVATGLGIVFAPGLVKVIAYGFGDVAGKWRLTIFMTRVMFPYLFFITLAALASRHAQLLRPLLRAGLDPHPVQHRRHRRRGRLGGGTPRSRPSSSPPASSSAASSSSPSRSRSSGRRACASRSPRPSAIRTSAGSGGSWSRDLRGQRLPGQLRPEPDDRLGPRKGERLGALLRLAHRGADLGPLLDRPGRGPPAGLLRAGRRARPRRAEADPRLLAQAHGRSSASRPRPGSWPSTPRSCARSSSAASSTGARRPWLGVVPALLRRSACRSCPGSRSSRPAFFSLKDTRTPVAIGVVGHGRQRRPCPSLLMGRSPGRRPGPGPVARRRSLNFVSPPRLAGRRGSGRSGRRRWVASRR
ncbi:MAG: hypothetical protein MZV64_49520 [Ignavibacteriales bacterium]|nr:hypothetical protein [Ignavibacteriales bacterium]